MPISAAFLNRDFLIKTTTTYLKKSYLLDNLWISSRVLKYFGGLMSFLSYSLCFVVLATVLKQEIALFHVSLRHVYSNEIGHERTILGSCACLFFEKRVRCWFYNLLHNVTLEIAQTLTEHSRE